MDNGEYDEFGRPWLSVNDAREGAMVEIDGGMLCREAGCVQLERDDRGVYFPCNYGRHYIAGQVNEADCVVGVYSTLAFEPGGKSSP